MIKANDIESMFPSLGSNLRTLNDHVVGLKNCQAMRKLRQTKEFIQTHPLISLFLAIFIFLGFLPFFIFAAVVSSSFLLVAFSAITVFGGALALASASFLVVMFPILMFGAALAIFVYLSYHFVVNMLRMIRQFRDMILSLPSRILPEFIGVENVKVKSQLPLRREHEEQILRGSSWNGNTTLSKLKLE